MDSKLTQLKRRETIWDYSLVAFMLIFIVGASAVLFLTQKVTGHAVVDGVLAVIGGVFIGYPVMHIMKAVDQFVRRRWVTSYYIEELADVVKVVESVRLNDWGFVKSRLIARRPSYRVDDDAAERFGCTMAAVPPSHLFLAARHELAAKGVAI